MEMLFKAMQIILCLCLTVVFLAGTFANIDLFCNRGIYYAPIFKMKNPVRTDFQAVICGCISLVGLISVVLSIRSLF
jgi:hypothetical protein